MTQYIVSYELRMKLQGPSESKSKTVTLEDGRKLKVNLRTGEAKLDGIRVKLMYVPLFADEDTYLASKDFEVLR